MKTIHKIFLIVILTLFQFCKSQDAKKYAENYNKVTPKLQTIAHKKEKFYNKKFSDFLNKLNSENIQINGFGILGKISYSEDIYVIRLRLYDRNNHEMMVKNNYQRSVIWVYFKEQLPDEIKTLTRKYEGELSPEVIEFLSNRKIESIEFYGINGLKSKDRTVR